MLIHNSFKLLDCLFIPYQSRDRVDFEIGIQGSDLLDKSYENGEMTVVLWDCYAVAAAARCCLQLVMSPCSLVFTGACCYWVFFRLWFWSFLVY
jgi:hypothetical protein